MKDSKVFVGRRVDIKNAWQLPQGGVEAGENLLDAARRELLEETNISSVKLLGSTASYRYDFPSNVQEIIIRKRGRLKYVGQEITFFAFEFLGEEKEINLEREPQEFAEWKWISPQKLFQNIVYFKRISYKSAFKEFQKKGIF
jgi:putative (di)nucleoside polyphosphate hydrolase